MNDRVAYWFDLCVYDLETAKVMLNNKRYLYVGFMCHQVAEKALKGYHFHLLKEDAPYTHSLKKLTDLTDLGRELSKENQKLLIRLENMNVDARYPKYKSVISEYLTDKICEQLVEETEGFLQWIQEKL
jgi:HEPN domain-containing protein